uniref:PDZ domain-containing protein n=1 Tax=Meloidogyne hapla TaxID=6305 RepID=A0A1I8C1H3_MELHA
MPGKADVHRSLELLEEYHAELFRSSDTELKLAIERVINTFKHSLFNALCDIHEFYENVLTNERIPVGDKIFESRRFAARWERSPILGPFTGLSQLPSLSPIRRPPQQLQPPRLSPNRSPSRRSFGMPSGGGSDTFLHTSPINRIVDENGQEWEVEEVILDVTKTGLGFSISGGRDRELDPVFGDKYIRVTDISPGGAVQKNGRLQVGDVILRVNDCDTANCDHDYAVQALKDAGTYIRLVE